MKLLIWLGIEITDSGGVRVDQGTWSLMKETGDPPPDGDAVEEVARRFVAHCAKISGTPPLPEGPGRKTGHACNGQPAEHTSAPMIDQKLIALGFSEQEAGLAIKMHGASRVYSLLQWLARKKEPISDPRALIMSCLAKRGGPHDYL